MMRIARAVVLVFVVALGGSTAAVAQGTSSGESRFYAQLDVAATLGHTSSGAIGAEAGYRFRPRIDVFAEGGHIGNVTSADMQTAANLIANNVGASANPVAKVNYFDVGARYHFVVTPTIHPYVAIGIGVAHVSNETTFTVNGTTVSPDSLGIQTGADLNGSETNAFLMIGGGTTVSFSRRYYVDLSYRFGGVLGATNALTGSGSTLVTNRVQLGIGMTF